MGLIGDVRALRRSWRIYHGDSKSDQALDDLYRRFVNRGDLVFDVGAHVGHRAASFARLGARVVAVEPQMLPALLIRAVWGWRGVTVVRAACGASNWSIRPVPVPMSRTAFSGRSPTRSRIAVSTSTSGT